MGQRVETLIVGGGVVGVCCAYELARAGAEVTLIERDEPVAPVSSAVYANAGLLTPGDPYPLASPGVLGKGLKWLLDSGSPFYVAPWADRDLPRWLELFRRNCREGPMRRGMAVQRALLRRGCDLHQEYADLAGEAYGYERRGWLMVYESEDGFAGGRREAEDAAAFGVEWEAVERSRLREVAPGLRAGLAGGVLYSEDGHLVPHLFVRELARLAGETGADIRTGHEALRIEATGGRVTRVVTTRGVFEPDTVVLAAGVWTVPVAGQLGLNLPIQAAKGYSLTVPRPEGVPDVPLYATERHVCVTPMGDVVRLAGTLELAGFDLSVRWRRVERIREGADRLIAGLGALEPTEVWRGLRPCTPDGLPIIGRSPRHDNVIVAAGHAMLGLGEGPITGRLVAQLVAGETPELDLDPLRVDRFPSLVPPIADVVGRGARARGRPPRGEL